MKNEELRMKNFLLVVLFLVSLAMLPLFGLAQQYTGMSGLIHVSSADMDEEGVARAGGHFLNREFTPDMLRYDKAKYHTMTHYLSITPFKWLEIGYTCTLLRSAKVKDGKEDPEDVGLYRKDRYFSVKLQPIREKKGKWWPSVAIGSNDPYSGRKTNESSLVDENDPINSKNIGNSFFTNFYVAATKHFDLKGNSLGIHVSYRYWKRNYNDKWNGPVGGITFQPRFQKNLRFIAEYTGDDINVGFDWKLWKFLLLQSSLQNGKYFTGGLCFCINLL